MFEHAVADNFNGFERFLADIGPDGIIDSREIEWAHDHMIIPLNAQVKAAAERHGWEFVTGIAEQFATHGYCADNHWIVRYDESKENQWNIGTTHPNIDGTMHPNIPGQQVYARQIFAALSRDLVHNVRNMGVWSAPDPNETGAVSVFGVTFQQVTDKSHQLNQVHYGLSVLNAYVIGANDVRFNAIWVPISYSDQWVFGYAGTDFQKKYDRLSSQLWRLKILNAYVINETQLVFNGAWKPAQHAEAEQVLYGWKYDDFRTKYDQLLTQNMRLKTVSVSVIDGQVLYTVSFEEGNGPYYDLFGWSLDDLKAKYAELSPQGWRFKVLTSYVLNNQVLYTAVFKQSTAADVELYDYSTPDFATANEQFLIERGFQLQQSSTVVTQ